MGDLSEIEESKLQELLNQKNNQKLGANGAGQKVVPIAEVKDWISKGYEFVTKLDERDAVIKLPK